jgi:hypothetical protein
VDGVVTSDGVRPSLSPDGGTVAYIHQGDALVREIAKVPKELYLAAQAAALRSLALNKAKQAGLALIMCAADMDDTLLPNNGNWQDALTPYLGDKSLLDGFNYTYGGGPMANIESPATTMIGFVNGPGGRAVVYADGHAKWIPN